MKKNSFIISIIFFGLLFSWFYLNYDVTSKIILYKVRFPRFLLSLSTGMILSGVGFSYQRMLNNPLADPYILGISSGAALGSVIFNLLGFFVLAPLGGFMGAILAMGLVLLLVLLSKNSNEVRFVLSGIVVSMFFSAFLSLLMYLNQQEIGNIITTLMGNLGHIFSSNEWNVFLFCLVFCLFLLGVLYLLMNRLAISSLGDEHALSLGIDVKKLRIVIFILTAFLVGFSVSFAGMIGFIGLIVPHLIHLLGLKSIKKEYLLSILVGGFSLLFCDFLAQHFTVLEIPVGVVTALIGCPIFGFLLLRSK